MFHNSYWFKLFLLQSNGGIDSHVLDRSKHAENAPILIAHARTQQNDNKRRPETKVRSL